jgi:hypothetical protein
MDSVTLNWFWFGLLVVVVIRVLAAPSLGVLCALSSLGHHNIDRNRAKPCDRGRHARDHNGSAGLSNGLPPYLRRKITRDDSGQVTSAGNLQWQVTSAIEDAFL